MTVPRPQAPASNDAPGSTVGAAVPAVPTAGEPAVEGLRERKKRQTRQELQQVALRLVEERGFDRVGVEEIAAVANVSKRTFFNYFPSKEAAVVDPGPDRIAAVRVTLLGRPAGEPPLAALRAMMLQLAVAEVDFLYRTNRLGERHPTLLQRLRLGDVWMESAIAEVIAERTGLDRTTDLLPTLTGAAATTALRTTLGFWHPDQGVERFAALLNQAFDLLVAGLTRPEG